MHRMRERKRSENYSRCEKEECNTLCVRYAFVFITMTLEVLRIYENIELYQFIG